MKPILLSFFKTKPLSLALLLGVMLLAGQRVQGQIYANYSIYNGVPGPNFGVYSPATDSWTDKTFPQTTGGFGGNISTGIGSSMATDGTYIYLTQGGLGFYKYDIAADTWAASTSTLSPVSSGSTLVYCGGAIYLFSSPYLFKFNIGTSTWSPLGNAPGTSSTTGHYVTTDGTNIYAILPVGSPKLCKYDPVANTWTVLSIPIVTTLLAGGSLTCDGTKIYVSGGGGGTNFASYDIAAGTWAILTAIPVILTQGGGLVYDGTNIYATVGANSNGFYKYNIVANTWTAVTGHMMQGASSLVALAAPAVNAVQATCAGTAVNNDASLVVQSASGYTNVGYSAGTTYAGPPFASAQPLGTLPFTAASSLPNPSTPVQPYTVRLFKDASTFTDITVMLTPKYCTTADLAITVTTTPQTGNQGEMLTYTATVTNNGPDTANGVMVDTPIPANATVLNGTPSQGTYNASTKKWDVGTVANGASKTLVITLKVN
jgi:uncharacterized repeat protein (TIGR01451 family)